MPEADICIENLQLMRGLRAASLAGELFITGGMKRGGYDAILRWEDTAQVTNVLRCSRPFWNGATSNYSSVDTILWSVVACCR